MGKFFMPISEFCFLNSIFSPSIIHFLRLKRFCTSTTKSKDSPRNTVYPQIPQAIFVRRYFLTPFAFRSARAFVTISLTPANIVGA